MMIVVIIYKHIEMYLALPALLSKLRDSRFKSEPGKVCGPVTIIMWGARLG